MSKLKTIVLLFITIVLNSCFHLHFNKVPQNYINPICRNITELSKEILSNYDTTANIEVSSMQNKVLKQSLERLKVDYVNITYRYDSTRLTSYQLKYFERIYCDSLINFGQLKLKSGLNIENWTTRNELTYYFGVLKPNLLNEKGSFSNLSRKVNDSIIFERLHLPHPR